MQLTLAYMLQHRYEIYYVLVSVQRGESHFKSGHIIDCCVSESQLVGFIRASMRDKT